LAPFTALQDTLTVFSVTKGVKTGGEMACAESVGCIIKSKKSKVKKHLGDLIVISFIRQQGFRFWTIGGIFREEVFCTLREERSLINRVHHVLLEYFDPILFF